MEPSEILKNAAQSGAKSLNEADSKAVLAAYGVPLAAEKTAGGPEEAATAATEIGFPVVLKGLGAKLTHKSELGLVRLDLNSPAEVEQAARDMAAEAGPDLEGFLLAPLLQGRRELVAGLFRDRQFGPVIMFGLGGIFTEALGDVVFRVAPIDQSQAAGMIDELASSRLLGPFRGEAAADRAALIRVLTGLSRLGLERPEVAEVDINPLLVGPDGRVTALDALVVLGGETPPEDERIPVEPLKVGALFHPKSVAFVGASAGFGKWGNMMFCNVLDGGFQGKVHLVNHRGGTMAGRHVYKSVTEIPDEVDLAVVTVPADKVIGLLPEMEAKGIHGMILITSGFGEVGPEGKALEKELVDAARAHGVLILGPNTMGICNPYHKFYCTGAVSKPRPGPTAFFSQSGNMGVQLLNFAERQGIGIRAFGGSGNEAMLTIEDALDGFAEDVKSLTVLMYVESVKNGRRFLDSARQVSRKKPVILLKGGRTAVGGRAAASHTGALASDHRVFQAACRQAGVILADQPLDLLDLSAAFSSLPLPKGPRVAIMTLGGGWGVVTADLCAEYGLQVPELTPEIISRIDELLPEFWSHTNPVDLVGDRDPMVPLKVMEELAAWDGCDAVINLGIVGRKHLFYRIRDCSLAVDPDAPRQMLMEMTRETEQYEQEYTRHVLGLMEKYGKPVIGVALAQGPEDKTVAEVEGAKYCGVFFPAPEQAVKSLSRMVTYQRWLEAEGAAD